MEFAQSLLYCLSVILFRKAKTTDINASGIFSNLMASVICFETASQQF